MRRPAALLAMCLALAAVALSYMAVAPPRATNIDDEARVIASTLKCPVCHDLSVADSPAPVAAEMRAQIKSQLQAGMSPDQIRQKFVQAYGPSILLTPPARGFDLSLWGAPLIVALLALGLTLVSIRRWTRPETEAAPEVQLSDEDRKLLERALSGVIPE